MKKNLLKTVLVLIFMSTIIFAEETPRPKVAVVLSGGSAFGLAHVGVLKEIEAHGIPIDMILGTSMGSIIGGLYASGYSPEEIEEIVSLMPWGQIFIDKTANISDRFENSITSNYSLQFDFSMEGFVGNQGLIAGQNIMTKLTELVLHTALYKDFNELPVPFRAVAGDILTGDEVIFSSGSMAEAMRASMSIPAIFKPYNYNGQKLIDGGIVRNMPVELAKEMGADIIIAIEAWGPPAPTLEDLSNPITIGQQSGRLLLEQNMKKSRELADLVITPNLEGFNSASFGDARKIIKRGEEEGIKIRDELSKIAKKVNVNSQKNRVFNKTPPIFSKLTVIGGSNQDHLYVQNSFNHLINKMYTANNISQIINSIYSTGRFEFVRFDLENSNGENSAVVYLSPRLIGQNTFLLNFNYIGSFSTHSTSNASLSLGVLLKNITGKNSALLISASIMNDIHIGLEYFQPIGSFYLRPFASYNYIYSLYTAENIIDSKYYINRFLSAGLWTGFTINKYGDISLGYNYTNLKSNQISEVNLSGFRISLNYDTRDSFIFPERGFYASSCGRFNHDILGSQLSFGTFEVNYGTNIPIGKDSTFSINAYLASDFSDLFNTTKSPLTFMPSFSQNGMFYGFREDQPGFRDSTLGALSLEIRPRLGTIHPILGGNTYFIGNVSMGYNLKSILPSGTIGIGAKITDEFGLLLTFSLMYYNDFYPAISVKLGPFNNLVKKY